MKNDYEAGKARKAGEKDGCHSECALIRNCG